MSSRRFLTLLMVGCSLFLLHSPVSARGRGGPAIFVGGGYGFGGYDPWWGPYPYGGYYAPATGTIKFDTDNKDTAVYIDGGYAGTVGKLKNLSVRPGSYEVELRPTSTPPFTQKVYVAAGKTVHVNPNQTPHN